MAMNESESLINDGRVSQISFKLDHLITELLAQVYGRFAKCIPIPAGDANSALFAKKSCGNCSTNTP
jgi:hypothetical protein